MSIDQYCAHLVAHGLVEGENHAAAHEHVLAFGQQALDHRNLGAHFGAPNDGRQRLHGDVHRTFQGVMERMGEQIENWKGNGKMR